MKNIKSIIPFTLFFIMSSMMSCSKDDTSTKVAETDARDLAVGTYNGLSSFTDTSGSSILDTTTTFVITKGPGTTLTITEDGTIINTGAIVVSGKDFLGNIPSQSVTDDGTTLTIKGVGNNNEHFGFQEAQKVFFFNIEITDGQLKGYRYDVFATKK
jgi:hypothetical protein